MQRIHLPRALPSIPNRPPASRERDKTRCTRCSGHVAIYSHCFALGKVEKELAREVGLDAGAEDGDHGKAAVSDLLLTGLPDEGLVLALQPVGSETDISGLSLTIVLVEVGELDASNREEDLHVADEADLLDGREGVAAGEPVAGDVGPVLLPDHAHDGKHGGATVLNLGPAGVLKVGLDLGEAHGVEPDVADHGAVELLGNLEPGDGGGHLTVNRNSTRALDGLQYPHRDTYMRRGREA